MPLAIRWLRAPLGESKELVAHIDECHPRHAAAQVEVEQRSVELERLVEIAHFERDVVEADRPCFGRGHCRSRPFEP